MAKLYPQEKPKSTHLYGDNRPPLYERFAVRAMVAVVFAKDYRRHIHRAKVAARRAEFEQAFEHAQRERARGARI